MRIPFFSVTKEPKRGMSIVLTLALFLISLSVYLIMAHMRQKDNPQDKLVPTLSQMADGVKRVAFKPDRNDEYRLLVDTWASVRRFLISLLLLIPAVILGLHMGIFPYTEKLFLRFTLFFDKIPALAVLPVLFIVFGLGEMSKIALIVIGVFPTIVLDTYLRAKAVPREQIIKAITLGASELEIAYCIVLPQILPKVLDTIRLNFKAMILFLIAGESLAATEGLGYRIFLVRRYIAMEIIIPYVIWISILAYSADVIFRFANQKLFPWVDKG
jgi:NitT/TauT family transport system permease protein